MEDARRYPFILRNRKKAGGARPGLYGGCSKMSQWNYSRNNACVYRAVCGRVLSCNRSVPHESLPNTFRLQKTNTSHLTVGRILNRHSHGHSYLCPYHGIRSDVQLYEASPLAQMVACLPLVRRVRGSITGGVEIFI